MEDLLRPEETHVTYTFPTLPAGAVEQEPIIDERPLADRVDRFRRVSGRLGSISQDPHHVDHQLEMAAESLEVTHNQMMGEFDAQFDTTLQEWNNWASQNLRVNGSIPHAAAPNTGTVDEVDRPRNLGNLFRASRPLLGEAALDEATKKEKPIPSGYRRTTDPKTIAYYTDYWRGRLAHERAAFEEFRTTGAGTLGQGMADYASNIAEAIMRLNQAQSGIVPEESPEVDITLLERVVSGLKRAA